MSVSASQPVLSPNSALIGGIASPLAAPIKKRRDPKSGLVYTFVKGAWEVDDAQTAAAAGRSARLVAGVLRSASGGAFSAVMTDNVNASLSDRDESRDDEADRKLPNFHSARQATPAQFKHFATCDNNTQGFAWLPDGVQAILGFKPDGQSEPQSFRFDKTKFTPLAAKAFLAKHKLSAKEFVEAAPLEAQRSAAAAGMGHVTRKANVGAGTWRGTDNSILATICSDTPAYSTEVKTGRAVKEIWLMSGLEFDPHVRMLNDHKRDNVREVLGSVDDFEVGPHETQARLYCSSAEPAICTKLAEGHIRDVSVGGERKEIVTIPPGQSQTIGGQTFTADRFEPLNIVTRMRVYEVSLTAVGADPGCVTRSASTPHERTPSMTVTKHMRKFMQRATGLDPKATDSEASTHFDSLYSDVQKACRAFAEGEEADELEAKKKENEAVEKETARKKKEEEEKETARKATGGDADAVRKAAVAEGAAAERARVSRLEDLGQGLPAEVVRKAILDGTPVETAAVTFLEVKRSRMEAVSPFVQVRSIEKDLTREVLGAALVVRSLSQLPSDATGATFSSNPTNLLNRYHPDEMNHNGIGDWRPDCPTRDLSEAQRKANEQLLNRAEPFRNLSMIDICRHTLRLDGVHVPEYVSGPQIVSAALQSAVTRADSGGAFSAIMTQNYNAMFLAGYLEAADTTMGWCSEGDAPDFKSGELATVGKMNMLSLNGKAPAQQLTYGDWNEIIQVSRYSGQFEVDEQDLINDRFGVLRSNSPQEMGLAARRVRPNLVYSILLSNYVAGTSRGPVLNQDKSPMFCAAHSNFLVAASNDLYTPSTGAVGVAGLQIALPAIGSQRVNSIPLNLTPRFVLISKWLDMGLRVALFSTQRVVASGSGGTFNPLQTFNLEPRADARLDNIGSVNPLAGNAAVTGLKYHYFLSCRPGEEGAKTMHVNYLLGSGRAPQIRSYILGGPGAPGRWGIGWDCKLDVGAAPEDFRGMYYAESPT